MQHSEQLRLSALYYIILVQLWLRRGVVGCARRPLRALVTCGLFGLPDAGPYFPPGRHVLFPVLLPALPGESSRWNRRLGK